MISSKLKRKEPYARRAIALFCSTATSTFVMKSLVELVMYDLIIITQKG